MRTPRSITATLVVAGGVALDQSTKALTASMRCGAFICPLANDELMLGVPAGSAISVAGASAVGLLAFAGWVRAVRAWVSIPAWPLGLVVAGIVSNLLDRLRSDAVHDFFAGPGDTLVNVADLLLGVGLVWCLALVVADRRRALRDRSTERSLDRGRR